MRTSTHCKRCGIHICDGGYLYCVDCDGVMLREKLGYTVPKPGEVKCLKCSRAFMSTDKRTHRICQLCREHRDVTGWVGNDELIEFKAAVETLFEACVQDARKRGKVV